MIKILNLIFFAGMILMNYLANSLPLNNKTTGELSDSFPNLFVPAGITFSIWAIIYLLLGTFIVVQFNASNLKIINDIGWVFAASCLFNGLWIVFWHYEKLPMSLLVMLGLLASLIAINYLIRDIPFGIVKAAFGVYLGWICIASIANVTAILVRSGWNGFGISEELWTIIMIGTGALIVSAALWKFDNPFIGLSVIWAFAGIILKRQADYKSIVIACAIAIIIVGALVLYGFIRQSRSGFLA